MVRNELLALALVLTITRSAARNSRWNSVSRSRSKPATPFPPRLRGRLEGPTSDARDFNWLKTEPFFAMNVKDWQPETPLSFEGEVCIPE